MLGAIPNGPDSSYETNGLAALCFPAGRFVPESFVPGYTTV